MLALSALRPALSSAHTTASVGEDGYETTRSLAASMYACTAWSLPSLLVALMVM